LQIFKDTFQAITKG